MCFACDWRTDTSLVNARVSTIVDEQPRNKEYRAKLAREQRANFETAKQYHFLCDMHLARYEAVVKELERANEHAND